MMGEIEVGYGGSDCSCKHIKIVGKPVTITDLLNALLKAQELSVCNVCIKGYQFNSLIDSIRQYCSKVVEE